RPTPRTPSIVPALAQPASVPAARPKSGSVHGSNGLSIASAETLPSVLPELRYGQPASSAATATRRPNITANYIKVRRALARALRPGATRSPLSSHPHNAEALRDSRDRR